MCHWSTCKFTSDQHWWCVGMHIHHWCLTQTVKWKLLSQNWSWNKNYKWLYQNVIAPSQTPWSMIFLPFSGSLPGHLTNCRYMWMPLRHSSITLYKIQMSSSCLTDISPRALRTSRGCREPDQVMYITWHHRSMLHPSKLFSLTWRTRSNRMLFLQKAFLTQATTSVQQSSTLSPLPMSVMFQWR